MRTEKTDPRNQPIWDQHIKKGEVLANLYLVHRLSIPAIQLSSHRANVQVLLDKIQDTNSILYSKFRDLPSVGARCLKLHCCLSHEPSTMSASRTEKLTRSAWFDTASRRIATATAGGLISTSSI